MNDATCKHWSTHEHGGRCDHAPEVVLLNDVLCAGCRLECQVTKVSWPPEHVSELPPSVARGLGLSTVKHADPVVFHFEPELTNHPRLMDPCIHKGTVPTNRGEVCCVALETYVCERGVNGGLVTISQCAGCEKYE